MLAGLLGSVEEVPELGALVFGIPLPKSVAVAEEALFGTGLFFVASSASKQAVEAFALDGFEQGHRLDSVAVA